MYIAERLRLELVIGCHYRISLISREVLDLLKLISYTFILIALLSLLISLIRSTFFI